MQSFSRDIFQWLGALWRQRILIAIFGLCGLALPLVVLLTRSSSSESQILPSMHESEAIFYFPTSQDMGFALPAALQMAKGEHFSNRVERSLDPIDSPHYAPDLLVAKQQLSGTLMKLSYFDESPERSLRILEKAVEVFTERSREIVGADVARLVEPARLVGPAFTVRERKSAIWIVLGLSLGLFAGVAVAILRTLISDLSKNPELLKKLRGEMDS